MNTYSQVTEQIGQNGRRGALMISLSCSHPDLEDFIDIKTDLNNVTKANISIRFTDEFMNAVKNDLPYTLFFRRNET
jgi:ribonucleoside-diphosphate reductase alpha chain